MVYLDNAATTPVLPEVMECMQQSMMTIYGNPSSTHQVGRKAKTAVELARKYLAKQFCASSAQFVFTAGGTEGNNWVLTNAVNTLRVQTIITSKIEHHAVLNTVQFLQKHHAVEVAYVELDADGSVDLKHLESLLQATDKKKLVSLMMVNNEIGNLLPIETVSKLCQQYHALFHTDAVQAVGHYSIDLQRTPIDFMVASAHKFHGPQGIGFLYVKKGLAMQPLLHGGGQEKGLRAGTENVAGIVGMHKALELAYVNLDADTQHIQTIKHYAITKLQQQYPQIQFNGASSDIKKSSCTILNVRFPFLDPMLLFHLDLKGIAVSGGSACQSGSHQTSQVLQAILKKDADRYTSVRLSFSKLTTKADICALTDALRLL